MLCRSLVGFPLILIAAGILHSAVGRAAEEKPAAFFRGLNLNGPGLTIDGRDWDGKDAAHYTCNGASFENQSVPLKPATDQNRTRMLRSSRWGRQIDVELKNIPAGEYQVFLYIWEDNNATRFDILVNDKPVLNKYDSKGAGRWERLGPWQATVSTGAIKLSARGGDANLSGIEVWSGAGPVPGPAAPEIVAVPTDEQKEFFERRIRPLLTDHCYECHSAGAKKLGGSLLLDSRAGIIKGGDTEPPIVPGDPESSLLITAVRHADPGLKMPPKQKLSAAQIADLEKWIAQGAPDPRTQDTVAAVESKYAIDWAKAREFWSFQPLNAAPAPEVKTKSWPLNDIDRFILSRLERENLPPAASADKRDWIRRATYDLIGLPPTPEEIDAFLKDTSAEAYASVVDRLLSSPHYGERWGRYWLDVVRYADTAGDNSDFPIPQMYKYRNWVIDAFNRDLPYDQFVRDQIAGDLLPPDEGAGNHARVYATGYLANARRFGSTVDDYPQHLTIEDTLDNLGRTFLGLTINCARCHDHKFDPLTMQDYYALYGFFHSTRYPWPGIELEQKQRDLVPLVSPEEVEAATKSRREQQEQLNAEVKRLEGERKAAEEKSEERAKLDKQLQEAKKAADTLSRTPLPFEQAYAVADAAKIEDAHVQQRGEPSKPGPVVHRRFLQILGGTELPADDSTSGRLKLAEWIVSPKNPIAARVMVNRIWLNHFGRGIVPTPNDFGKQGKPPTHPELLDWLAARFMESGWSVKSMHRLIMLSQTYRLASHPVDAAREKDAANELLSYFPRRRLDAEAIRDTLLALGDNLDPSVAGPHPFPPQTEWKFTQHNPFKAVYETNHRSVYLMTQRIQRHPYLAVFDGADSAASTPQRMTSTTPLQALYLLNDPFVHEQSVRFANRLLAERNDNASRIERAYRLALGRLPQPDERETAFQFLEAVRGQLQSASVAADEAEGQAWQAFARAMFRLNEFIYID
jgi:hypothetical protein